MRLSEELGELDNGSFRFVSEARGCSRLKISASSPSLSGIDSKPSLVCMS